MEMKDISNRHTNILDEKKKNQRRKSLIATYLCFFSPCTCPSTRGTESASCRFYTTSERERAEIMMMMMEKKHTRRISCLVYNVFSLIWFNTNISYVKNCSPLRLDVHQAPHLYSISIGMPKNLTHKINMRA